MLITVKHHDFVVPVVVETDQPAGALIFLGDMPAVTLEPMRALVPGGVAVGAVIEGPRETGSPWPQGTVVYWDATNRRFTTTATGNRRVGVVVDRDITSDAATRAIVLMDR